MCMYYANIHITYLPVMMFLTETDHLGPFSFYGLSFIISIVEETMII